MRKLFFMIIIFLQIDGVVAMAATESITLQFQQANLVEVVREMAAMQHMNVVVHPDTKGVMTMRIEKASPAAAFDAMLATAGLSRKKMGDVWMIAPANVIEKQMQRDAQWQTLALDASPLASQLIKIHYATAKEIALLIQGKHQSLLSNRGRLQIDERTNSLYVEEAQTRLRTILQFIRQVDVPVSQVLIEARLVSIDNDYERELGVEYVETPILQKSQDVRASASAHSESGKFHISVARLAKGSTLDVKLSALERAGHAALISSPSLFAADREQATIEAGEEVPYQEVSESGGTAVTFKKAVLGLKVTPHILPDHRVLLRLQVNQDRPSSKMVLGVPTISTQQMMTSVFVESGHTVALGGIYERDLQSGENSVPFLGNLPLIGWLFKQTHHLSAKRQLFIFVTPTIVASTT
jgi:type IV pilus assembly protein PilQ